jgi:hypothetical protein
MADPHIIGTSQHKRHDIARAIAAYQRKIEAAGRDPAHINATMAMFEAQEGCFQFPVYMDTMRLFRRGESEPQ